MRIGVLSKNQKYWSTHGILRAIEEAGHEPVYMQTYKVRLVVGPEEDSRLGGSKAKGRLPYPSPCAM